MSAYETAHLDEIVAEAWPYWAPIRHHFGIESFGINGWRGGPGDEVIKKHDHAESEEQELYLVLSGRATFTVGDDEIDAPAGTCICIKDASLARVAFAQEPDTVVLSIGAERGRAYEGGWDTSYLEG
jgi:uncharacterized cupin superfamily protein